jgi:hypothetical protein
MLKSPRALWLAILSLNFLAIIWQLLPPPDLYVRPPFNDLSISAKIAETVLRQALSVPIGLAIPLLAAFIPFIFIRRTLGLFLLGLGMNMALICFRYFSTWHTGTVTVYLIFALWIALDRSDLPERKLRWLAPKAAKYLALGSLAIISVLQIREAALAGWNDYNYPYSASLSAAEFIKEKEIDRGSINALDIHSFAILPYFDRNIFANYKEILPGSFWIWSKENERRFSRAWLTNGHPDYLLVTMKPKTSFLGGPDIPGYEIVQIFPGQILWKSGFAETDALVLYHLIK